MFSCIYFKSPVWNGNIEVLLVSIHALCPYASLDGLEYGAKCDSEFFGRRVFMMQVVFFVLLVS